MINLIKYYRGMQLTELLEILWIVFLLLLLNTTVTILKIVWMIVKGLWYAVMTTFNNSYKDKKNAEEIKEELGINEKT